MEQGYCWWSIPLPGLAAQCTAYLSNFARSIRETRSARAVHSEDSAAAQQTIGHRAVKVSPPPDPSNPTHNPNDKNSPRLTWARVDGRRCGEDGLALTQRLLVAVPLLPASSAGIDRCSHRRRSWKTAARGSARRWKAATARLAVGGLDVPHICCTPAPSCIALHHPAGAFHSSSGMPSPPHRRLRHTAGATSVNLFVAFGL